MRRLVDGWLSLAVVAFLLVGSACAGRKGTVHPQLTAAGDRGDALAAADALDALIAVGEDSPADREYAYGVVRVNSEDTAPALYARAAVMGRFVQERGFPAANLIPEIERCAHRSREIDPDFRDGAATRLLGTLYVMAPAGLLSHGDSEVGLELLEDLVRKHPEGLENHLRLAEAYVTLGDPAPAAPSLCRCLAQEAALSPADRVLLRQLIENGGTPACARPSSPAP